MTRLRALIVVVFLLGAAVVAAPSSAVGGGITLSVSPERIQLSARPGASAAIAILNVRVTTSTAVNVTVSLKDVVADEAGTWAAAPAGSTSYSLQSALTLSPTTVAVSPAPSEQSFPVTLSVPVQSMDQPRAGIVAVTLVPNTDSPTSGTTVNQGLGMDTVVVAESAPRSITDAGNVKVSIEGSGLTLASAREFTIVDSTLPDIPGLVDHGPVTAVAKYRNNGDFIVDAQTTFDFGSVGPMSLFSSSDNDPGNVFYRVEQVHQYALPGQPAASGASSLMSTNGLAPIDTLPFIGFVKVTATTTGTLGPLAAAPVVQSSVFLVFPWKEALALVLVIVLWVLFKRWRRNRRDRKNQPPPVSEVREPVESVT